VSINRNEVVMKDIIKEGDVVRVPGGSRGRVRYTYNPCIGYRPYAAVYTIAGLKYYPVSKLKKV